MTTKVTSSTIQKDIEENPFYPSLYSLSETFSRYKINNKAFEIEKDNFEQLEPPFIAFLAMPNVGKDFVLVTRINTNTVEFFHRKKEVLSKEIFLKYYQKIVWAAEPDDNSGDQDFYKKRKEEVAEIKQKKVVGTALATTIILSIYISVAATGISFTILSILLLKLVGVITSILLLIYEIDKSSPFVKSLCSIGSQVNCDAVLSSKAAKIGRSSWSEIGFFYFASTTMWLLFPGVDLSIKTTGIFFSSLLASPYVFFSIYYQWKVIKQWCPLCLTIQLVLVFELAWSVRHSWLHVPSASFYHPTIYATALICLLLPAAVWLALKKTFIHAKDAKLYLTAFKRVQYNPEIFSLTLLQQPEAPGGWQNLGIGIGNQSASTTIVKVCNPYCNPCSKIHPELEEIIKQNNDLQVRIIFITRNNELDKSLKVVKHLLAIASKGNERETMKALDDWYTAERKDYEEFSKIHPVNSELLMQESKVEAMSKWCDEANITHTPTLFINGYRMPENYELPELKYIL